MRILVTGGAGFIGSHVAEAYVAAGHDVCIVDNLATGRRANAPRAARLYEIDLHAQETERVFQEFKPEIVNHHAAQASVKVSTGDPVHDLEVNGGGTARIASLAARFGVRKVIYAGSGGTAYGHPQALPVGESHPVVPVSPYGMSKVVGEQYLGLYHRTHGLEYTTLRYANAYGPRQDPNGEAGVVAIFTGKMLAGAQCTIDGDGEQRKDYVYAGDIASANVLALDHGSGLAVNIGTGEGTSVNTIFATLHRETGNTVAAAFGPPRTGDVRDFWLDTSLAKRELGWSAKTTFEEGIRLTVAWYRAQS
jgi:UDP-glucose 4-epimerase